MTADQAPAPGGEAAPRRWLLPVRVAVGAAIAAGAIAFIVTRAKPHELELAARFEPAVVPAGSTGRLVLAVRPGPQAPAGARIVGRPQIAVEAPPEVRFDRPREYLLSPDEELTMSFAVAALAAPGTRELRIIVTAELLVPGGNMRRPACLRRTLSLAVGPPGTLEKP